MDTKRNYRRNTLQARCTTNVPGFKTSFCISTNIKEVFANYSVEKLNKTQKINLTNYYRNNANKLTTRCLICEINVGKNDIFEHTVSSTHEYNKLFCNFVQKRNQNGDIDYIISDANWVQCRYCNNVRIPRESNELRNSHAQDIMHLERKQYCFNRVTGGDTSLAITQCVTKISDPCVNTLLKPLERNYLYVSNERQTAAGPSREMTRALIQTNHVSSTMNLETKEYCLNRVAKGTKNLAIQQHATKPQNPYTKTFNQVASEYHRENSAKVSNECQFTTSSNKEITGTQNTVTLKKPYYRSHVHGYEVYDSDSDSNDGYYRHRPIDNHYSSPSGSRVADENDTVPTWVWAGIGGLLAWRFFKSL